MLTKSDLYLAPTVSRRAVNVFFSHFEPWTEEIHAIEILHGGIPVLRIAPAHYS